MPDLEQEAAESRRHGGTKRFFMRFTREQRYMHAVLFTTFLGLAATGLPIRFSESIWARGWPRAWGALGRFSFFTSFSR